jgi:formate C-acetyltransferase
LTHNSILGIFTLQTLKAGQKEPEKYRELVVKVAGYNAFFTHLYREIQDTIIARIEHGL